MSIKQLKEPFQYEKIPIESISKDIKDKRAKNTFGTIKRIWSYLMSTLR